MLLVMDSKLSNRHRIVTTEPDGKWRSCKLSHSALPSKETANQNWLCGWRGMEKMCCEKLVSSDGFNDRMLCGFETWGAWGCIAAFTACKFFCHSLSWPASQIFLTGKWVFFGTFHSWILFHALVCNLILGDDFVASFMDTYDPPTNWAAPLTVQPCRLICHVTTWCLQCT